MPNVSRYPWNLLNAGQWFSFEKTVKLGSARSMASLNGRDLNRKFRVWKGSDGVVQCQRIDGLDAGQYADGRIDVSVGSPDDAPPAEKQRRPRYRYPWSLMQPGEWFYFAHGVTADSARTMTSKIGSHLEFKLVCYRATNGKLVCQRIDNIPSHMLPDREELLPSSPGGPWGTRPRVMEAFPNIEELKGLEGNLPVYGPEYDGLHDEITYWQIREAGKPVYDNAELNRSLGDLRSDEYVVSPRDAEEADKYAEFFKMNFREPHEGRAWCKKKMPPEELDGMGCPIDKSHPFWRISKR